MSDMCEDMLTRGRETLHHERLLMHKDKKRQERQNENKSIQPYRIRMLFFLKSFSSSNYDLRYTWVCIYVVHLAIANLTSQERSENSWGTSMQIKCNNRGSMYIIRFKIMICIRWSIIINIFKQSRISRKLSLVGKNVSEKIVWSMLYIVKVVCYI